MPNPSYHRRQPVVVTDRMRRQNAIHLDRGDKAELFCSALAMDSGRRRWRGDSAADAVLHG